jgi:hypothetical protein
MVVCGAEASNVRKAETVECALAAAAVIKTKHLEPGLPRGYMVNDDSEIPWLPGDPETHWSRKVVGSLRSRMNDINRCF